MSKPNRSPRVDRALAALGSTALALSLLGCEPQPEAPSDIRFRASGTVQSGQLDELSGLQASRQHEGLLWTHNDDGRPRIHAVGSDGADRGHVDIIDGVNVDWEDMTLIPGAGRDALVLADIGDNDAARTRVWLYIVEEPQPDEDGQFSGEVPQINWISLSFPDGPRDAESIAWDPVMERLLILSKRDSPPRLYALDGVVAVEAQEAELTYLGEVTSLRPPASGDRLVFGERAPWVSQPTGMAIAPDGRQAAIISYRSLYLFDAQGSVDWRDGLNATPTEILGPPRQNEEAISFKADGSGLWVSAEGDHPPIYEFVFRSGVAPEP